MASDVLVRPPEAAGLDEQRLRNDFAYFARTCLKIVTKQGELIPLRLNRAQLMLHERLELQRAKGKVRAIVIKGRQLGISTYIQARFYWRLWRTSKTLNAFILTHHDDATSNLFNMAHRFHENLPLFLKPETRAANAKQLVFADSGCAYHVATAGAREVARSQTIQLFHGSELPSWPNAESHVVSLLTTALAKSPESEGILEATAKGVGNVFHRYAMAAVAGESEYEAIFIPWFWGADCQEPCPDNVPFSEKWIEYGQLHRLHWEHLYWAWKTNREMAKAIDKSPDEPCSQFHEEYPATLELAFQTSGDSFIPSIAVMRARRPESPIVGRGPVILGVDPARDRDKVGIIDRCGRRAGERICELWPPEGDTVYLAQKLAKVFKRMSPDAINVDIGHNPGLFDLLRDMGFGSILNPVNFGGSPLGKGPTGDRMYANRRSEMWDEMRGWFEEPGGVQLPARDDLHTDITAPIWGAGATRENRTTGALILESKDQIKERIGRSPDLGDALALTFAVPFADMKQTANVALVRNGRRTGRGGY